MLASAIAIRSLPSLLTAGVFGIVAIALLFRRRKSLPRLTVACLFVAIVLLVLAGGELLVPLPRTGEIVVMVDLSPSTRSAMFRDRASLDSRLRQLLGSRSFRLLAFAQRNEPMPAGDRLADLPAPQTVFDPPTDADAIVLLSDGRFEPPKNAPPIFPVIDPGLIDPPDAAVIDARVRGGSTASAAPNHDESRTESTSRPAFGDTAAGASRVADAGDATVAEITVRHHGEPRTLSLDSAAATTITVDGDVLTRRPLAVSQFATHRAELTPGDAWPENDALTFADTSHREWPRWWIGNAPAPPGWAAFAPAAIPSDPGEFLAPSVIALSNVAADDLSPAAIEHLQQYVRDLGGSLLILGGDHAFGLGAYSGSVLDDLSPLASDPPTPAMQWLLLTDASGSMAAANGDTPTGSSGGLIANPEHPGAALSRWSAATSTLAAVVRELPPADSVSVGSFAADVRWWINAVPVRDARSQTIPPANAVPSGPTNLQPVLEKLVEQAGGDQPKNLLVLTDGEATLDHADSIAAAMKSKQIRLHVLAIGSGAALPALRSIATTTGGSYALQLDAAKWLASIRTLVRGAMPDRAIAGPMRLKFWDYLIKQPTRTIERANRTWLKLPAATPLAFGDPLAPNGGISLDSAVVPLAGRQTIGNGQVLACAFTPTAPELSVLAALVAAPPRDPRYQVDWQSAGNGKVRIDAADRGRILNGLAFELRLSTLSVAAATLPFEQTAPGRYEATLPESAEPRLAKIFLAGHELDRQPIAGRYQHEFDAIGLDRAALTNLAHATGGRVIDPDVKLPIDLPRRWRDVSLTPLLAIAAAVLIAVSLVHWKRRGGAILNKPPRHQLSS